MLVVLMTGLVAGASTGQEMRGAWVTAWTSGFFTAEEVDATVAAAKRANLNALFIQVRKNADSYYKSATEPRGSGIAPGFDPLKCVIEKAHAEGIEVHAWINSVRIWAAKEPPSDPMHIVNRRPQWVTRDNKGTQRASEGLYLDPGIPEAREYIASIAEEIARNYDVDGIHLDYIRYPGKNWGYSETALSRYYGGPSNGRRPDPGDAKWLQWRRDQVTELVKLVRAKVKVAKPGVKLTAATIPWGDCGADYRATSPYMQVCQDWRLWIENGLIDANIPMNYKSESNAKLAQQFRNWLGGFRRWNGGRPVYVGLDIHNNQPQDIVQQIAAVRKAGHEGFVLFSFNQSAKRTALVETLRSGPCSAAQLRRSPQMSASRKAFEDGVRHAVANQLGMAKVFFRKAIELDPTYAEACFRLGRCHLREKDNAGARQWFQKTLEIDPRHADAKKELDALR